MVTNEEYILCRVLYNFLAALDHVHEMPAELYYINGTSSEDLIKKVNTVIDSDYFKNLPDSSVILFCGNPAYQWNKIKERSAAINAIQKLTNLDKQ